MNLRLVRIDDRLIHGQVVHGWMPRLGATLIVVADARLAESPDEQMISKLAVPPGVDVVFVAPESVAETLRGDERPTVVLFRTPLEAELAVRHGFATERLNLGNLHFEPGKVELRKTFCCSGDELAALRRLSGAGIAVEYRPAPDYKGVAVDPAELPS